MFLNIENNKEQKPHCKIIFRSQDKFTKCLMTYNWQVRLKIAIYCPK